MPIRACFRYFFLFRALISHYLRDFLLLLKLSGPIEIDETFIGSKRRGNHGRLSGRQLTIFGINVYFRCIGLKCRSTATLLPYIIRHAQNGAMILSDKSSSYVNMRASTSGFGAMGFDHYWVNHTANWAHPVNSSINTNSIERVWRSLKGSIRQIKRKVETDIIEDYMNSFLIRTYVNEEILLELLLHILSQY